MAVVALSLAVVLIIVLLSCKAQGRILRLNSSEVLVSDGVDRVKDYPSPFSGFTGISSSSSDSCEHYYGFLPCADNIGGYLFQIVVFEYLLAKGEKFLTTGSKQLFNILGTGFFGDVFEILMVLPEIMVVLIFCLTLQWGICLIFGRKDFAIERPSSSDSEAPTSKRSRIKEAVSLLTDSGITTDKKTSYSAGLMLLSLIPFIIVQLSNIINTSSGRHVVILIALIVSVSELLSYFIYQIYNPWIQERSLEYTKYENLLAGFLDHVQRQAKGRLITDEGTPNIPVIKSLFANIDKDGSRTVSRSELEALVVDMKSGKLDVEQEYAVAEVMKAFDKNKDGNITEEEFIEGCKRWIHEARTLATDGSSHSRRSLRQVVQPWIEKRKVELAKIERLMSRILKHVQNQVLEDEGLLIDDGSPNLDRIKNLFSEIDSNNNNLISESELKQVIQNIKFGAMPIDHDLVADEVMKDFDKDGDNMIDEQEFVNGISKWLHQATRVASCKDAKRSLDEFDKIAWKEVESLVFQVEKNRGIIHKLLSWDCIKSVFQILLGVAIVSVLAEPLMYSILDLSVDLGLPTFDISFVIIPFALKFKLAVAAIFPASQKSIKTASLTFSEIYGAVIMNNITGMSILLAIVYIKGLTWDYSVEVLVVLVVCAIIGFLAFFFSKYALWTSILAFSLYPFSLGLVHFLHDFLGWD
ncbi:hypothetical protein NMG60_11012808 [Bertholletia excelsa]